jgi:hypothetical protein
MIGHPEPLALTETDIEDLTKDMQQLECLSLNSMPAFPSVDDTGRLGPLISLSVIGRIARHHPRLKELSVFCNSGPLAIDCASNRVSDLKRLDLGYFLCDGHTSPLDVHTMAIYLSGVLHQGCEIVASEVQDDQDATRRRVRKSPQRMSHIEELVRTTQRYREVRRAEKQTKETMNVFSRLNYTIKVDNITL